MRRWTCWLGHNWSFPMPHVYKGAGTLWRGCSRCGRQQVMSALGHWRYTNGQG